MIPLSGRSAEWCARPNQLRAAFFEVDGQVFQRAIDYPDVELAFYDLSGSGDPVREARGIALSIQRTPMSFSGPLFKFALFRTRLDESYLFACCHHIVIDGFGIVLVSHRIASVYSAIVSGAPIPPALFGSLRDLVDCELEYEASNDYLEDQAYWTRNLPSESGPDYRLPQVAGERDLLAFCAGSIGPCGPWPGSTSYPRCGMCLDPRLSPRRARFWCVGGALRARRWCSTSRSAGEYVRSQRRFPGWLPGWCRWC